MLEQIRNIILAFPTSPPWRHFKMTTPKLAATRPAALTGRIGLNGENRIHDVALVQTGRPPKR